jgi:hypothetical protein
MTLYYATDHLPHELQGIIADYNGLDYANANTYRQPTFVQIVTDVMKEDIKRHPEIVDMYVYTEYVHNLAKQRMQLIGVRHTNSGRITIFDPIIHRGHRSDVEYIKRITDHNADHLSCADDPTLDVVLGITLHHVNLKIELGSRLQHPRSQFYPLSPSKLTIFELYPGLTGIRTVFPEGRNNVYEFTKVQDDL